MSFSFNCVSGGLVLFVLNENERVLVRLMVQIRGLSSALPVFPPCRLLRPLQFYDFDGHRGIGFMVYPNVVGLGFSKAFATTSTGISNFLYISRTYPIFFRKDQQRIVERFNQLSSLLSILDSFQWIWKEKFSIIWISQ